MRQIYYSSTTKLVTLLYASGFRILNGYWGSGDLPMSGHLYTRS
jgi:hypothetical protein